MSTATYSSLPSAADGLNGLVSSEAPSASIQQSLTLNGSNNPSSAPRPLHEIHVPNGLAGGPVVSDTLGGRRVLSHQSSDLSGVAIVNGSSTTPVGRPLTSEYESLTAESSVASDVSAATTVISDSSPPKPDEALVKALMDPKDRIFVLRMADSMESIVNQRSSKNLNPRTTIQCANSYQRALVYRCAQYYKVTVEPEQTVIHVFATTESKIPPLRIAEVVPAEQNTSTSKPMKIMRRAGHDITKASSASPSPSHGRSAASSTTSLLEPNNPSLPTVQPSTEPAEATTEAQTVESSTDSLREVEGKRNDQTEYLIKLGLAVAPSSSSVDNRPKNSAAQRKTLEERTADYEAARSRIFDGFSESQGPGGTSFGVPEPNGDSTEGTKQSTEDELSASMMKTRIGGRNDSNTRRTVPSNKPYPSNNARPPKSATSDDQDEWDRGEPVNFTFPTLYDPDAPSSGPAQQEYDNPSPSGAPGPSQHYIDHTGQHHYPQNTGYPTQPFVSYPHYPSAHYPNQFPPPQPMNQPPPSHPSPATGYPQVPYGYYPHGAAPPPAPYPPPPWHGYGGVPMEHPGAQPHQMPPPMQDPSRIPMQVPPQQMGQGLPILPGPQQPQYWPGQIHPAPPPAPPPNGAPGPSFARPPAINPYPGVYSPSPPRDAPLPQMQPTSTGPQNRRLWSPTQPNRSLQSVRDGTGPGRNGNFNQSRVGGRSNAGSASSSRSTSRNGMRYPDRLEPTLTASPMGGGSINTMNGGRHGGNGRTSSMSSTGSSRLGMSRNHLGYPNSPVTGTNTLPPIVMGKDGMAYALDRQHSGGPRSSRSSKSGTQTPLDETASVASVSSTSSNSSGRTFTSTSSKHPSLPARPDWIPMSGGGGNHPRSSSSSSPSHSRTHSASRPPSHQGAPPLHPTDFPPLPGGTPGGSPMRGGAIGRGGPAGVWNSRPQMPLSQLSSHSRGSTTHEDPQAASSVANTTESSKPVEHVLTSPTSAEAIGRGGQPSTTIPDDKSPYMSPSSNLPGSSD